MRKNQHCLFYMIRLLQADKPEQNRKLLLFAVVYTRIFPDTCDRGILQKREILIHKMNQIGVVAIQSHSCVQVTLFDSKILNTAQNFQK